MNKLLLLFICILISGCSKTNVLDNHSLKEEKAIEVVMYTTLPNHLDNNDFSQEEHIVSFNKEPDVHSIVQTYFKTYLLKFDIDSTIQLSYNDVFIDENHMAHIDLTKKTYNIITAGNFLETAVLDGLSKTILLNINDIDSVTYTVDGNPYVSTQYNLDTLNKYKNKSDYLN